VPGVASSLLGKKFRWKVLARYLLLISLSINSIKEVSPQLAQK